MEGEIKQEKMGVTQQELEAKLLNRPPSTTKGGFRTIPIILVNDASEKVANFGLQGNMIFYLTKCYHLKAVSGASIISIWTGFSSFLAIVGAFLSDSYLGRFRVVAIGSFSIFLGTSFIWLTSMVPQLKPLPCEEFENTNTCDYPTASQLVFLLSSLGLIAIGTGCIRSCSTAFGIDQISNKENPNNERVLSSFVNWNYITNAISTILGMTIIVYVQDHLGWPVGFAIPAILVFLCLLMFLSHSSTYVKVQASKSLFTGFVQVLVAAFRNRNVDLILSNSDDSFHQANAPKCLVPTNKLRCLNKACIIRDPEKDLNPDGSASNPWRLCTVDQVESLKALLRVLPMWSTSVILLACQGQSFSTLQASTMNRHITSSYEVPAGSFSFFTVAALLIFAILYDRIVVPFLAKYMGRPLGLSPRVRMGAGLLVSWTGLTISAIIETIRREKAVIQGLVDDPNAVVDMSAMWLLPQYALFGIAEALNSIGQIELYYSQFPEEISSMAMAIFTLGMGVSGFVGSLLINIVNGITTKGGNTSWLSSNINKGHIDYFYWLCAFINFLNFFYFLICNRAF